MIYVLLLLLIACLSISLHFAKNDVVKPNIIVSTMFIIAVMLSALYTNIWNMYMHLDTVMVIASQILLFIFGGFIADAAFKDKLVLSTPISKGYDIPWKWVLGILAVILLCIYFNYLEISALASKYTNSLELAVKIKVLIRKFFEDVEHYSKWHSLRNLIIKSASFIALYAFIVNVLNKKPWRSSLKFFLIAITYVIAVFISTGRQAYIIYGIYGFSLFCLLYQSHDGFSKKSLVTIFKVFIGISLAFFLLFYGAGRFNGKIRDDNGSPFRVLSHYAGTNINAFDVFLHKKYPDNQYIGSTTLTGVYNKLNLVNPNIPKFRMYITEFTDLDGINTNVYTAMRRYIQDFGLVGCSVIMFLFGLGSTFFYNHIKYRRSGDFQFILYGVLIYPMVMLFREERFLNEFIGVGNISLLLALCIGYFVLKKLNIENRS